MPTILVTGANGFIAAHCITRILSHPSHVPLRVRGTVRTPEKAQATRTALSSACGTGTGAGAGSGNAIANLGLLVVSDPTDPTAMRAAMSGCDAVLHLASAFTYDAGPGEFEEKLLGPAVRGTVAVCDAAAQTDSVRKVVIMSSFAAVYDAAKGLQPGKVYTEEDWSPLGYEDGVCASIVATAYRASKVVAERAAWDFIRDHELQYKLVTLCPGMVFGTMLHPIESLGQLNVSNGIVWEVLKGDNGIPATKAPVWVDVDDLAIVSLKALTVDLASHERFLVTAGAYDTQQIADVVRAALPETRGRIPVGEPGKRIRSTHYSCDSSKVQRVLGVEFKGLAESVIPLARQLYAMEQASMNC